MSESGEHGPSEHGVHLIRTAENAAEIDALAAVLGGRVGLEGVLSDLDRRARRSWAPGRAVRRALTWDRADRRTTQWWPQGISTSADACDEETVLGRRLVAVTWYAKPVDGIEQGSRVTFLDLDTRRYRHVLLVVPTLHEGRVGMEPLQIHAGGLVWRGDHLHVAATGRGFMTCRVDDLLRVPDGIEGDSDTFGVAGDRVSSYGYRYLLPVRLAHRAAAAEGAEKLRYSFMSLDRSTPEPQIVVGEYARGKQTRRLATYRLGPGTSLLATDEEDVSRPLGVDDCGVAQVQGAVRARGSYYLTTSHGPLVPGSVHVGEPGAFRRHRFAAPIGPEDIAYWPSTDTLWSVSEHPHRRWVYSMRRTWFD